MPTCSQDVVCVTSGLPLSYSSDSISTYSQDQASPSRNCQKDIDPLPVIGDLNAYDVLKGRHIEYLDPHKFIRDLNRKWSYLRDVAFIDPFLWEFLDHQRWMKMNNQRTRSKIDWMREQADQSCGLKKAYLRIRTHFKAKALDAREKKDLAKLRADFSRGYVERQLQRRQELIEALFQVADAYIEAGRAPRGRYLRRQFLRYASGDSAGELGPLFPVRSLLDTREDKRAEEDTFLGRPRYQKIRTGADEEVASRCACFY